MYIIIGILYYIIVVGDFMDIKKIINESHIEYLTGDNCVIVDNYNLENIYDLSNKMYFMINGSCKFILTLPEKKVTYILKAGDMLLIPAGMQHSIYFEYNETVRPSQKIWISFRFDSHGKNFFDLFSFPYVIKPHKPKKVKETLISIITEGRKSSPVSVLKCNSLLLSLISIFIEESGAASTENNIYTMDNILQFIEEHLDYDFSIQMLADMAHMHPTWFIRKFKALTDTSPMKYITSKRMLYARTKLELTTMSISEIMQNIGFTDSAHFSKTFKAYTPYSPKKYRTLNYKANKTATAPIYASYDSWQKAISATKKKQHTLPSVSENGSKNKTKDT